MVSTCFTVYVYLYVQAYFFSYVMFVDLFRKSVNKALPLLSIPLIPEGNVSGTEERNTQIQFQFLLFTVLSILLPPLISSHSLNILIFHLTPPPFHSVLTFFLLDYSSSISFIHSVHSYLHVFELMVDTFSPLQHRLHISTPLHFSVFPPSLFFHHMHLSLFLFTELEEF